MSDVLESISVAEVNIAVRNLHRSKAAGVDKIHPGTVQCWNHMVNMPHQCCL